MGSHVVGVCSSYDLGWLRRRRSAWSGRPHSASGDGDDAGVWLQPKDGQSGQKEGQLLLRICRQKVSGRDYENLKSTKQRIRPETETKGEPTT